MCKPVSFYYLLFSFLKASYQCSFIFPIPFWPIFPNIPFYVCIRIPMSAFVKKFLRTPGSAFKDRSELAKNRTTLNWEPDGVAKNNPRIGKKQYPSKVGHLQIG